MTTLYCNKIDKKICKWNNKIDNVHRIMYGSPVVMDYKKFHIVSNHFDILGTSEVAIVNNIRTTITKEKSPENIIYYDENARTKFSKINQRILNINSFNPSEYGNSIFYYTPSYQNTYIDICTKMYEIDTSNIFLRGLSKLLNLGNAIPTYGAYFSLAGTVLSGVNDIIERLNYKKELVDDHVINFHPNDEIRPLLYGCYICFHNTQDEIKNIIENYELDNYTLIDKTSEKEYNDSYFVIELLNMKNDLLYDFDFSHTSNEMLQNIMKYDTDSTAAFFKSNSESMNFNMIQDIIKKYNIDGVTSEIKSTYDRLSPHHRKWFDTNFSHIKI